MVFEPHQSMLYFFDKSLWHFFNRSNLILALTLWNFIAAINYKLVVLIKLEQLVERRLLEL